MYPNIQKSNKRKGKTYLNSFVKGLSSATGILRILVPGGRKLRNAICTEKLPISQN